MFSTKVPLDVAQRVRMGCFHWQSLRFFKEDCDTSKIKYSDQVIANAATIWKVAEVSYVAGHVLVEFKQPKGQAVVLLAHHAPHGFFFRIRKRKCSADGVGSAHRACESI